MNRVIDDADTEAWVAIRRSGRPSVRMAARSESDGAIRCTIMVILHFQGNTLPP
jgi:hypothetical protein